MWRHIQWPLKQKPELGRLADPLQIVLDEKSCAATRMHEWGAAAARLTEAIGSVWGLTLQCVKTEEHTHTHTQWGLEKDKRLLLTHAWVCTCSVTPQSSKLCALINYEAFINQILWYWSSLIWRLNVSQPQSSNFSPDQRKMIKCTGRVHFGESPL